MTDTVAKYDGGLESCRRWDERRLAYPMNRKNRATFYLAYHDMPGDKIPGFLRDLELNESVLRYLMVRVEETPEESVERQRRGRPFKLEEKTSGHLKAVLRRLHGFIHASQVPELVAAVGTIMKSARDRSSPTRTTPFNSIRAHACCGEINTPAGTFNSNLDFDSPVPGLIRRIV